jgi:hypothetical protein
VPKVLYVEGPYRIVERSDRPGQLQICATVDDKRYRVSAGNDLKRAKRQLSNFISEMEGGWRPPKTGQAISWELVAKVVTLRQRNGAKSRGIPFQITAAQVFSMMRSTDFRCSVSGVALSKILKGDGEVDPWAPSIDRIDNRQGYTIDNVRIVCIAANLAMNRWGYDTLLRLARGVVRSSSVVAPEPIENCPLGDKMPETGDKYNVISIA